MKLCSRLFLTEFGVYWQKLKIACHPMGT